jgi:uncharacterized protein YjbI with pentapeptide repeats
MSRRAVDAIQQAVRLWVGCLVFGAVYGAVCGALFGLPAGDPMSWSQRDFGCYIPDALGMTLYWTATGAWLGAMSGGVAGTVTVIVRRRLAWYLGVAFGSALPASWMFLVFCPQPSLHLVLCVSFPSALMVAVCWGLITGRSALPGVQQLAMFANDTRPRSQTTRPNKAPREPIPASRPQGRGDEPNPSRLPPAACGEATGNTRNRVTRVVWAVVAIGIVGATGLLVVRLQPYWVAKYRGQQAKLRGASLPFAPLAGANLVNCDLAKANLFRANLTGAGANVADFTGADLTGANLTAAAIEESKLNQVRMRRATARGASLAQTTLVSADLRDADLTAANLDEAVLRKARLDGAVLTHAYLVRAKMGGAVLTRASLRGANLREADLGGATLAGADLAGALYDKATRWPAGFDPHQERAILLGPEAPLHGADLRGAFLASLNLRRSDLSDANLAGADLSGTCLRRADLRRADLCQADLSDADLTGANLAQTKLFGAMLASPFATAVLIQTRWTGARYDQRTRWPAGFNPQAHGAILVK